MKQKIALVLICICIVTMLTGCWGKSELRDVGIVSGIGIDAGTEAGFELTTQTIKPGDPKAGTPASVLIQTSKGATVFDGVRNFIITAKKKQIFQHIQVVIIGRELAMTGISPALDFFMRDHEPRSSMDVFIADQTAGEILQIKNKDFPIPSLTLKESVRVQEFLSKAPQVSIHNFYQGILEPYQDPYLPIIHKVKDNFEVYGTAIFNGEKLVGDLTAFETRGMLRVLGDAKAGIQVVKLPSSENEPILISIEIKKSKSSIKALFQNGQPSIQVEIKETGFIGDVSGQIRLDQQKINEIKGLYAKAIKLEVEKTIIKIQKQFKSNVFDFAGTIQRTNKKYWKENAKQWDEIYPELSVNVNVQTDITANGLEE
ncbi:MULTISPECIES: Ger(x)C family spore germination protein [Mesobacillus]|uniref:Ger(X)C family spore germination protein n=2 Tax=Mesobacillus TaxID=2675231 RepID=A0A0D6Z5V8_9BACI|nr:MULTISPECIES: Ger(x)C family spore germination protein [Mesobacillus]KIY20967.1 hypothetical protein UB32_16275 [Mesobacillus subterraneus]MDQ0413447.1 spore germination protein KC [Mesobacillus stamsii]